MKRILDNTRNPRLAEDEEHTYDDKYALVEFVTNTAVASQMNAFERLGLDPEKFKIVAGWVHGEGKKSVTLRFKARDSCAFLKERDVDVVTGTKEVEHETADQSTSSGFMGMSSGTKTEKITAKVITKIKEYHWKVEAGYAITIFAGSDPKNCVELDSRSSSTVVVTSGGQQVRPGGGGAAGGGGKPQPPIQEATDHPPVDADVTWFFRMIQPEEMLCQFKVDRTGGASSSNSNSKSPCRTPRRNADVDAAFEFNRSLMEWNSTTQGFFYQRVQREILGKHDPAENKSKEASAAAPEAVEPGTRGTITGLSKEPSFNGKFVTICEYLPAQHRYRVEPVDQNSGLPGTLLIKPQNVKVLSSGAHGPPLSSISDAKLFCPVVPLMEDKAVLSMSEVGDFLSEQCRSMDDAIDGLTKTFAPRQLVRLVSIAEATVVLLCQHLQDLATAYQDSVDYVEHMLRQQLVQAIGKEVQPKDFDQFMVFHNERLYGADYAPKPFSYAIRRPGHYPDGTLTIECTRQKNEPIHTWVRHVSGSSSPPMFIPLNAATSVEICGDRYLHGWMQHMFKTKPRNDFQVIARARQFSSFVLVLGTLLGADKFDPKDAIILQNKDEVLIPLLTNTLPSAKEFKDAIASLSPEQQAFARSFRKMQLESSVFGICIIQLRPQLEKLLGLPDCALTKEIQLTQDLLSLFVEYQIPSDLMTYDGPVDSDTATKVSAVKGYVKSIMDVIEKSKEKQLVEEERKADMRFEMEDDGMMEMAGASALIGSVGSPKMMRSTAASADRRAGERPAAMMADSGETSERGRTPRVARRQLKHASPKSGSSRSLTKALQQQPGKQQMVSAPPHSGPSMKLEAVQPSGKVDATGGGEASPAGPIEGEDFTMIPKILDTSIDKFDSDHALRSCIIKPGASWTLMRQANLLTRIKSSSLSGNAIESEKKKAFDLLDAISRSGVLPIHCSELHVVVGVSHCFDNDVMGSVVQENMNPIEKVERSGVMIASTIHAEPPKALIREEKDKERLASAFPLLLKSNSPLGIHREADTMETRGNKSVTRLVEKLNSSR